MTSRGEIDPANYTPPGDDGSVPASTEFDPAQDEQDTELPDTERDYDPDPEEGNDAPNPVS